MKSKVVLGKVMTILLVRLYKDDYIPTFLDLFQRAN